MRNDSTKEPQSAFHEWYAKMRTALDVLGSLNTYLSPPASGGTSEERLSMLLDIRERFQVEDTEQNPLGSAANAFAGRVAGNKEHLFDRLVDVLSGIDTAIALSLTRGAKDERVINPNDFRGLRLLVMHHSLLADGTPVSLYAGQVSSLPEDHWLHAKLPQDLYLLEYDEEADTGVKALILGPPLGNRERPFYSLDYALRLTSIFRAAQKRRHEETVERLRQEEKQRIRDWWASEAGKQERLRRELDTMREKGHIPPDPEYQPVIRY